MTKEERIRKEIERLESMRVFEAEAALGARFVFGIDEAGRGPLCGPVAAACCIINSSEIKGSDGLIYLNDSKKLSESRREALYGEIIEKADAYGIGLAGPDEIDEINILNATLNAMKRAFEDCLAMYMERQEKGIFEKDSDRLIEAFEHTPGISDSIVLVDGNKTVPGILFRQTTVVGGDARCPSISAASILAKVYRDRIMKEYALKYPQYGFAKNKGYGTREHITAIREYGVLDIHRRSFLKKLL